MASTAVRFIVILAADMLATPMVCGDIRNVEPTAVASGIAALLGVAEVPAPRVSVRISAPTA